MLACMQERRAELLALWQPALSPESAMKLDMKRYLTTTLVSMGLLMSANI